jgi:hypothetical protein
MAHSFPERKAHEWRRRLRRYHKSRQSVVAFCRQEGVSQPTFYFWRKRLAQAVEPTPRSLEPAGFRPVRLLPAANVDVRLPGGTQLIVPLSDPEGLRLVIETLARVDADHAREARPC